MKPSNSQPHDPNPAQSGHTRRKTKRPALAAARNACEQRVVSRLIRQRLEEIEPWLVANYGRAVGFAAACGIKHSKDVVHDAWLRAQCRFDPSLGGFPPLFWAILRRVIADFFRMGGRIPSGKPLDEETLILLLAEDQCAGNDRISNLRRILDRLPPDLVGPILDHYGRGIPQRELAARYGCSLAALKMRLKRGRCSMAAILRVIGCHSVSDVDALGERSYHRPLVIAVPRAFRPKSRPSCRPPGK